MNSSNNYKKRNMMSVSTNGFSRPALLKNKCSEDLKSFNTSVIKYRSDLTLSGSTSDLSSSSRETLGKECHDIGISSSPYIVPKIPLNFMQAKHANNNNKRSNGKVYFNYNGGRRFPEKISLEGENLSNCSSPLKTVSSNSVQFMRPANTLVSNKFSNSSPCVFYPSCTTAYSNISNNNNNNNNGHIKSRYYGNQKNNDRRKMGGNNSSAYGPDINKRVNGLMERFSIRSKMFFIPAEPLWLTNGNEFDPLNRSIWEVYSWNAQKRDTYLKKLEFWKIIYLNIQKVISRYGLYLVGSTMSGLGLDSSDIDMCLLVRPSFPDPRRDALEHLQSICEMLERSDFVKSPELIMAKVPILKFRDSQSRFEVDLNCNNAVGIRNTHLLSAYSNLDWRVRPLVLLVKLWAQANDINDAKRMTINSYSLTLMVIHFLQCGVNPPALPCLQLLCPERFGINVEIQSLDIQDDLPPFHSDNTQSLGELLLGFLHYYTTFNYNQFAISVRQGMLLNKDECRFARSPKNDATHWKLLCVEEPFELTNAARCVYDVTTFEHIKSVFRHSYEMLMRTKNLNSILTPLSHHHPNGNNY